MYGFRLLKLQRQPRDSAQGASLCKLFYPFQMLTLRTPSRGYGLRAAPFNRVDFSKQVFCNSRHLTSCGNAVQRTRVAACAIAVSSGRTCSSTSDIQFRATASWVLNTDRTPDLRGRHSNVLRKGKSSRPCLSFLALKFIL